MRAHQNIKERNASFYFYRCTVLHADVKICGDLAAVVLPGEEHGLHLMTFAAVVLVSKSLEAASNYSVVQL